MLWDTASSPVANSRTEGASRVKVRRHPDASTHRYPLQLGSHQPSCELLITMMLQVGKQEQEPKHVRYQPIHVLHQSRSRTFTAYQSRLSLSPRIVAPGLTYLMLPAEAPVSHVSSRQRPACRPGQTVSYPDWPGPIPTDQQTSKPTII